MVVCVCVCVWSVCVERELVFLEGGPALSVCELCC